MCLCVVVAAVAVVAVGAEVVAVEEEEAAVAAAAVAAVEEEGAAPAVRGDIRVTMTAVMTEGTVATTEEAMIATTTGSTTTIGRTGECLMAFRATNGLWALVPTNPALWACKLTLLSFSGGDRHHHTIEERTDPALGPDPTLLVCILKLRLLTYQFLFCFFKFCNCVKCYCNVLAT